MQSIWRAGQQYFFYTRECFKFLGIDVVLSSKLNNPISYQRRPSFPRLSSPHADIKPRYDVVVIGSGYGGSIAASRCARAGQTVCVLERGKEWLPGEFPETFVEASKETQISFGGKKMAIGKQWTGELN